MTILLFPRVREALGAIVGLTLAPVTGAVSWLRQARMFHPEGVVYAGRVAPAAATPWPDVARRLAGPALARLSTAWWRHGRELPDVLGLALRLCRDDAPSADAAPGDQDLLLATIRRPLTTLPAAATTQVHDFLANDYYGVAPFTIDGIGVAWLRAVPACRSPDARDRGARLARAVAAGRARFTLEVAERRRGPWRPLAVLALDEQVDLDQARLRFHPFRAGRGIHPRGFVHALRHATYASSQWLRPRYDRRRAQRIFPSRPALEALERELEQASAGDEEAAPPPA